MGTISWFFMTCHDIIMIYGNTNTQNNIVLPRKITICHEMSPNIIFFQGIQFYDDVENESEVFGNLWKEGVKEWGTHFCWENLHHTQNRKLSIGDDRWWSMTIRWPFDDNYMTSLRFVWGRDNEILDQLSGMSWYGKVLYSFGQFFVEILGSLSHSKLMALSGHDATDKISFHTV